MAPGLYVLKVEARTRLGKGFAASREVQFRDRAVADATGRIVRATFAFRPRVSNFGTIFGLMSPFWCENL